MRFTHYSQMKTKKTIDGSKIHWLVLLLYLHTVICFSTSVLFGNNPSNTDGRGNRLWTLQNICVLDASPRRVFKLLFTPCWHELTAEAARNTEKILRAYVMHWSICICGKWAISDKLLTSQGKKGWRRPWVKLSGCLLTPGTFCWE